MRTRRIARWAGSIAVSTLVLLGASAGTSQADGEQPAGAARGSMLLLDTSGSMSKDDLAVARNAALVYSRALPPDVRVGLIRFAEKPEVVTEPTTNRTDLATGLAGLRPGGETSLYDAIGLAVSALEKLGGPAELRLVVLSDGMDTSSGSSLSRVRNLLVREKVVADFIAFRYGSADRSAIRELAKASGGQVLTAEDAAQLSDAFSAIARSAPKATDGNDGAFAWLPSFSNWTWQLWLVAGVTFTAVLLLALVLFQGIGRREDTGKRVLDQIKLYGPRREAAVAELRQESSLARSAVGMTEELLRARGWEEKVAEQLDLAAMKFKPGEWTLLRVCAAVVAAAALILLGVNFFIGVALGGLLGWVGTLMFVTVRISRRRRAFAEQLPDVLQLVAGSLQSGFSLAQALDAVVREDIQPTAGEVARAMAETRIGVETEDALDRVAARMASDDMKWIVMAIRIQREVGGNLAEVLLTTVVTMRERARTRRQVRALSAEGRLSAYVLLALPMGIGGFVLWSNPDYLRPLYTTGLGIFMLFGAVVFMVLGTFWMSRVVKVEV